MVVAFLNLLQIFDTIAGKSLSYMNVLNYLCEQNNTFAVDHTLLYDIFASQSL